MKLFLKIIKSSTFVSKSTFELLTLLITVLETKKAESEMTTKIAAVNILPLYTLVAPKEDTP